jgi:nucleotide-binding universal stress UspA family protein
MRESDLPILTVSPDCSTPGGPVKKRFLIPVSSLNPSFRGFVKFRQIVCQMESSVHLLHVVDFDDSMFHSSFYSSPFRVVDLETEDRKQRLVRIGRALSSDLTNIKVDPLIRFGDAAKEILNEINSHQYDIVLMKIRKGTLGSRFFDSVAYQVISRSVIPVITIRANS